MMSLTLRRFFVVALLWSFASVDAVAQNTFTMAGTPPSSTVSQGGSVPITISTAMVSGSAEMITLSASGLPVGVTPTFSPNPVSTGGTSTLTLAADIAAAPIVSTVITVNGVSASDMESTTFDLTVDPNLIFQDEFDGPPCTSMPLLSSISLIAGQSDPHVGGDANVGDSLTLSAFTFDPNSCTNGTSLIPYAYEWLLINPPGSSAVFSSSGTGAATVASPSFIPDLPHSSYTLEVVVTDAIGNASPPSYLTITTSSCGAEPVDVLVNVVPGTLPTDPVFLTAIPSTSDADSTMCPPRFAPFAYWYSWTVTSSPPSSTWIFSTPTNATTTFLPSIGGTYNISAAVIDSNNVEGSAIVPLTFSF